MNKENFLASTCRFCRFYQPEGRRGGSCQKLSVPVKSHWSACALSSLPFTQRWENLEDIIYLEHSLLLNCPEGNSALEINEVKKVI